MALSAGTYDLEIDNNIPLRLDISAVQNTDIGKSYGIGSQTFVLPGTKANNQFFQHAYDVGAEDVPAMYNDVEAYILLDGENVLEGRMHLMEIMTDDDGAISYRVQIEDTSINFVTALDNKLISDADFSAYNHTYTVPALTGSWLDNSDSNVFLSGSIFYPLCDYGTDQRVAYPDQPRVQLNGINANDINLKGTFDSAYSGLQPSQFLPAIRVRELFDVIFDQAGFSYTSSLINGSDFDDLYVLPKAQDANGPVPSGATDVNTMDAYVSSSSATISGSTTSTGIVPFNGERSDAGNNFDTGTYKYTTPTFGNYNVSIACFFSGPNTINRSATLKLSLTNGIKTYAESEVTYDAADALNPIFKTQTLSFNGFIQGGQPLRVEYEITAGAGSGDYNLTFVGGLLGAYQNSFEINTAPFTLHGSTINMADQFDPKTKSIDLVRGILSQFNAVIVPLPDNPRVLEIENFTTFINNGRDVDWTDKIDNAQKISIKNPVVEQPREIKIKNVDDEDRFSKLSIDDEPNFQYGTIRILNQSNLTTGETEIETDSIAPVVLGSLTQSGSVDSDGNPTYNLDGGQFVIPHLYKFDNNAQTAYKFKPRLGYKIPNLTPLGAANGVFYVQTGSLTTFNTGVRYYATLSNLSTLPATSTTKDLHFDNGYPDLAPLSLGINNGITAYTDYYSDYVESLYWDEGRKIVASIYFTPEEYRDIRLNDNIIVKNQKYRINKISGYNLQDPDVVEVELIKLFTGYSPAGGSGELVNGWAFTAGTVNSLGVDFNGLHIASELAGSNIYHGGAASPTTATREVTATTSSLSGPINSGSAIDGIGTAASYALTQFDHNTDSDTVVMSITNTVADPSTTNPGTLSLSGTINDNVGNSGTWSANLIAGSFNSPYNPESTASSITLNGITLTDGRTYSVHLA